MFNINNLPFTPVPILPEISVNTDGEFITTKTGKPRYTKKANNGYIEVRHTVDRHTKGYSAHRLIALTFLPNPHNLPCVNHKDGDKHNNALSNLEWTTFKDNTYHAYRSGLQSLDKLNRPSPEIIRTIRSEYVPNSFSNGIPALVKKYGISKSAIFRIVNGMTYKDVN